MTPDGRYLLSGSTDRSVRQWSMRSGRMLDNLGAHNRPITSLVLLPGGRIGVSVDYSGVARMWQVPELSRPAEQPAFRLLRGPAVPQGIGAPPSSPDDQDQIVDNEIGGDAMAVTRDGQIVAYGGVKLRMFNPATGRDLALLHDMDIAALAFSPSGNVLASGAEESGAITLFDMTGGGRVIARMARAHGAGITALRFLSTGRLLSASLDGRVRIWDLTKLEDGPQVDLPAHSFGVTRIALDQRETLLATGGRLGAVRLWLFPELELVATFRGLPAGNWFVSQPDGKYNSSERGASFLRVQIDGAVVPVPERAEDLADGEAVMARMVRMVGERPVGSATAASATGTAGTVVDERIMNQMEDRLNDAAPAD